MIGRPKRVFEVILIEVGLVTDTLCGTRCINLFASVDDLVLADRVAGFKWLDAESESIAVLVRVWVILRCGVDLH